MIGVLALQGGFATHAAVVRDLGDEVIEVRVPADLEHADGLILPGGESTTMALGVEREGLAEPLRGFAASGRPVLGTCAGMILLGRDHLGVLDIRCERNAFGRQSRSFETELDLEGREVRAVFIRAPRVVEAGSGVKVLAVVDGYPVAVRQGDVVAVAFHPELAAETRLHADLVDRARSRR